jgi:hypothetical protein
LTRHILTIQKKELVYLCRSLYTGNNMQMKVIDEFEENYDHSSCIWWYTRDCFLYWMLNKALRTQDTEMMMKMGFFLQDLHNQIKQLYLKSTNHDCLTAFRGQGVSQEEFDKIKRNKGGLLLFNNFLSTSVDQNVGYLYADSARQNSEFVGIIFQIRIDRSVSSTPFASVQEFSYFNQAEKRDSFLNAYDFSNG